MERLTLRECIEWRKENRDRLHFEAGHGESLAATILETYRQYMHFCSPLRPASCAAWALLFRSSVNKYIQEAAVPVLSGDRRELKIGDAVFVDGAVFYSDFEQYGATPGNVTPLADRVILREGTTGQINAIKLPNSGGDRIPLCVHVVWHSTAAPDIPKGLWVHPDWLLHVLPKEKI